MTVVPSSAWSETELYLVDCWPLQQTCRRELEWRWTAGLWHCRCWVDVSYKHTSNINAVINFLNNTHTHSHTFNGPFSGFTWVSWYQKGKTNLGFTEARDSKWQWHQLDHMQVFTSLQTDNHTSTHRSVFYRQDALPVAQPTVSKHWRHTFTASKHWRFFLNNTTE